MHNINRLQHEQQRHYRSGTILAIDIARSMRQINCHGEVPLHIAVKSACTLSLDNLVRRREHNIGIVLYDMVGVLLDCCGHCYGLANFGTIVL